MAQITMTVPDEVVPRLAFTARNELEAQGVDTTGMSNAAVVKRWTRKYWIASVSRFEGRESFEETRGQAAADLEGIS